MSDGKPAAIPPMFKDFVAACDAELEFLVDDHGFQKNAPQCHAYECSVAYYKSSGVILSAFWEPGSAPWFSVTTLKSPGGRETRTRQLHRLAAARVEGWVHPKLGDGPVDAELRQALRLHADLLRQHFMDLLGDSDGAPDGAPSGGTAGAEPVDGAPGSGDARRGGLLKLLGGGALYAVIFGFVLAQGDFGESRGGTFYIITMGAPGALALAGLFEVVSDQPFEQLAARWDRLPAVKKAGFSAATIVAAFVIVFGPLLFIGWLRDG